MGVVAMGLLSGERMVSHECFYTRIGAESQAFPMLGFRAKISVNNAENLYLRFAFGIGSMVDEN
jgi:hypothetical protein